MRILILAAGAADPATLAQSGGYPVLLAEIGGRMLVELIVEACTPAAPSRIAFVVRDGDARRYRLANVVSQASPLAVLHAIRGETAGAACTALVAIQHIAPEEELLVLNGNEIIDVDVAAVIAGFRSRGLDAGTLVFPSLHPRYSYVKLDDAGLVVEAAEKNPVSRHATVGFYWWRRGADFIRAVQSMIRKDAHVGGAFFICPAFNELILADGRVGVERIRAEQYRPVKSLRQLERLDEGG